MRCPIDGSHAGLRAVCLEPPIYVCDDFVSAAQCSAMIGAAASGSGPLPASGGSEAPRTSSSMELGPEWCDELHARAESLTTLPAAHMELPTIARYLRGQRYIAHHDAFQHHLLRPRYQRPGLHDLHPEAQVQQLLVLRYRAVAVAMFVVRLELFAAAPGEGVAAAVDECRVVPARRQPKREGLLRHRAAQQTPTDHKASRRSRVTDFGRRRRANPLGSERQTKSGISGFRGAG